MKYRLLLSALFKFRNIAVLAIAIVAARMAARYVPLFEPFTYPAAFGVYVLVTIQTLASKKFHEEFNSRQKIRHIQDLNYTCLRLFSEAKRHANPAYYQKLRKVMDDKNDIVDSFFRGEKSYLKERIVEQTLNLVISYIKLLTNLCIRSRELDEINIAEITDRINLNMRKLSFVKDPHDLEDLKKVIEMDEKVLNRIKDEKRELERINIKLDYMESTISMFKHQAISSIESEEMLEKLEQAVNEAAALDSVLEERRKNRIRL